MAQTEFTSQGQSPPHSGANGGEGQKGSQGSSVPFPLPRFLLPSSSGVTLRLALQMADSAPETGPALRRQLPDALSLTGTPTPGLRPRLFR